MSEVTVTDNQAEGRYEAELDGELVGRAMYRAKPDRIVFTHTEVSPAAGGKGVGSALARAALDDVRARGLQAVPMCPFIADFIKRHPGYADLVPAEFQVAIRP